MWPFKKKTIELERDKIGAAIAKLEAFRKIGETFNCLGRTCVVTGHWDLLPFVGVVPLLRFDYCDESGRLHAATFLVSELPALENQQKEIGNG